MLIVNDSNKNFKLWLGAWVGDFLCWSVVTHRVTVYHIYKNLTATKILDLNNWLWVDRQWFSGGFKVSKGRVSGRWITTFWKKIVDLVQNWQKCANDSLELIFHNDMNGIMADFRKKSFSRVSVMIFFMRRWRAFLIRMSTELIY